ncbi:uncharacterized protein BO66DRAFT_104557 [Aspergillus aculeatinus CBS 121060]|uniref:Uncharacterized protein n=1 Tax=Aspergillus aculeatinus CBS 121060 TaxID=1448322 RepID=A0ACD1H6T6_9EURO|nr:hypothetical protein BO66DRAFT_104557 [Aspergillus aculeatinus CBS 121060]RAH69327.1 hypothetical protein BO66DRAFT_104557 [Aspergillus aculeatinus CBS 121060]
MNYGGELYSDALRVMAWILRQRLPPTPHVLYTTIVFHTYETTQTGEASLHNCLTYARGATAALDHRSFRDHPVRELTRTIITRQKLAAVSPKGRNSPLSSISSGLTAGAGFSASRPARPRPPTGIGSA